jgi:hypothetical protein
MGLPLAGLGLCLLDYNQNVTACSQQNVSTVRPPYFDAYLAENDWRTGGTHSDSEQL